MGDQRILLNKRISIVDDHESMREAIKTLMEFMGATVEGFSSAEGFLNSGRADACDCLILDFNMPGINGLDLQRQLVADQSDVPIVFITGHFTEKRRSMAIEAGAIDFLAKPFSEEELLGAVNAAIASRRRGPD